MAKGSNNLRSKKSHASKPYDVSNSFVKKVSSLLPQSSWLSRWLTPPVQTLPESEAESESEAEEENGAQPPPSKRAKIPLNRPFPTNSFRVASPSGSQGLPEQLPENATSTPIRSAFEDAVAGPSGLGRSRLHAAPAFQPSPSVAHSENLEGKLNGDGCSDSSESTSGCSSLVPQASRQIQSDSLAARRRSIDENLSLTNHLQSPRSLFPNRVRSPRFTPSMSRRRPSFNVSAYGSPLLESEKSTSKDKDSSMISPFYSGQTMYGGASAYRRPRDGMLLSEMSMSKHAVQVRPATPAKDSPEVGMSHTARRILEALEQFSTPVSNAKRMPLVESPYVPPLGSKRKRPLFESTRIHQSPGPATRQLTIPTVPDILKMRRREQLQDSMEKARLMAANEPYRLRTEHDNAKEGKRSGKVSKANPLDEERLPDGVNLPNIVLPITSLPKFDFMVPPAQSSASSHISAPPKTSSHTLAPPKISSHTLATPKTSSHTLAPPKTSSQTMTPPKTSSHTSTLPKTTSHTLTSHNTISHASAPSKASSHALVSPKTSSHSLVSPQTSSHILTTPIGSDFSLVSPTVSDFTFAPPIKVVGNFQVVKPTTDNFTFSKPLSAKRTENCVKNFIPSQSAKVEAERKSSPVCDVNSNRVVVPKNNGQNSDVGFGVKATTELKTSSVMDVVDKKEVEMGKGDSRKENLGSGGFGTMFKPPANSWECSMCMIRNNSDASKCAACMAPRPQTKKAVTVSGTGTTTTTTSSLPAFGSQFKLQTGMWECPSCMVRNKDSDAKCKACTGAKPGAKAVCSVCLGKNVAGSHCQACQANKPATISTVISTGGFGDKFRQPEGSWSCTVCMIINKKGDAKCTACQELKPGPVKPVTSSPASEKPVQPPPTSQPASSVKFNFLIPPEANTFKFGIDKAGEKDTKPVTSDSCKGFVFGASAPTPPVNFKFGVSAPVSDPVVSKPQVSAPVPTLPITTAATTAAAPTTSGTLSSVGTVSSTSPTASPAVVFAKPAVPSKKVLTSFGNTQPQSRDSTTKSTTSEDTNKGLTSDVADSSSDSKGFKFGGSIGGPAVSTSEIKRPEKRPINNEQTKKDEPPTKKDESTKKESSDSGKSIPAVEAKPTYAFTAPSSTPAALTPAIPTVSNPVKSVKTASVVPTFNFTVNPSSAAGALSTTVTTSTTTTTSTPSLFTFGKTATTLPSFGSSLKSSVPAFTFGSNNSPTGSFKSQDVSATKKKAVSFGGNATSATSFGVPTNIPKTVTSAPVSTNFGSPLPTVAGSTFGTNTAPSFGAATTSPSFGTPTTAPLTFGTTTSKPSFATPSSSTPSFSVPTTKVPDFAMPTTAPTFGTTATPAFGSGFSSSAVLKQPSAPSSTTHPFIFGSTSSSGTPSAAFSFSGAQNGSSAPAAPAPKVPTFNFGASNNTANLAPASVSTPGFGGFNFSGSSGAAPAAPSVFGGTTSTSTSFGPSNTSASFNTPTFNFGAGSQPFGFTANPSSGIQPAQTVQPVAPTFSFGQAQPQPAALPTFNPNARPTFNFTGGETPQFTAAASTSATTPTVRRIKKAVRRNVR